MLPALAKGAGPGSISPPTPLTRTGPDARYPLHAANPPFHLMVT